MEALVWVVIANVGYEVGLVFYNAFLPDLAPPDRIGRISGAAWGLGYAGGLLALAVGLFVFVLPEVAPLGLDRATGEHIRATNLLVAAWFAVFSIPAFLFIREIRPEERRSTISLFTSTARELGETFRTLGRYRQIVRLLVARLFYNDGLVTIFSLGGIYAAGTFGFTTEEIIYFGMALNVAAGLGAFVFGFVDDKVGGKKTIYVSIALLCIATLVAVFGQTKAMIWAAGLGAFVFGFVDDKVGGKKTIYVSIALLCIATLVAVFGQTKAMIWAAGLLVGLAAGPNQSASRSLLGRFVPDDKETEFYGFFAFSGKLTAFMGPLLFGILTTMFDTQRAGVAVVLVFFLLGALVLTTVDEREGIELADRPQSGT
jgi:UMF1 family MFS transporter